MERSPHCSAEQRLQSKRAVIWIATCACFIGAAVAFQYWLRSYPQEVYFDRLENLVSWSENHMATLEGFAEDQNFLILEETRQKDVALLRDKLLERPSNTPFCWDLTVRLITPEYVLLAGDNSPWVMLDRENNPLDSFENVEAIQKTIPASAGDYLAYELLIPLRIGDEIKRDTARSLRTGDEFRVMLRVTSVAIIEKREDQYCVFLTIDPYKE